MKNSDVIIGYIRITSTFKEISHGLLWVDTDNRYIIPMKSLGFLQTPQDIMEEYNGRSVPQYTAYPLSPSESEVSQRDIAANAGGKDNSED